VFDPDRDDDPGTRPFYLRLLAVALISVAGCVALWPSVTGFSEGVDREQGCVAILDGWHADPGGSNAAEVVTVERSVCIPESRHRLIVSGLGLGALAVLVGGATILRRTRTNLRPTPASVAGT